jgi:hypothetical protein
MEKGQVLADQERIRTGNKRGDYGAILCKLFAEHDIGSIFVTEYADKVCKGGGKGPGRPEAHRRYRIYCAVCMDTEGNPVWGRGERFNLEIVREKRSNRFDDPHRNSGIRGSVRPGSQYVS